VPKNLDGLKSKAVFEATHSKPDATVHWHLDDLFIGSTEGRHRMELDPDPGEHFITLVDQLGGRFKIGFEVVGE
jgi:penicillin-binding protein 1C